MSIFKGVATALITPFKESGVNGEVDYASLERLVNAQLKAGINALVVLGTTGEPTTMTHDERISVAKRVFEIVDGAVPIIFGAGSNNTYTAAEYAIEGEQLGAKAVLTVTPYYNKCTQNGIVKHFEAIAEKITVPIIAYNVPGRTGVNIEVDTVKKLKAIKGVVAIKEASGQIKQFTGIAPLCDKNFALYSGDDDLTYTALTLGGEGIISVASNVIPGEMLSITKAFFNGEYKKARDIQFSLADVNKYLFSEVNPIPVKFAAKHFGLISDDYLRLPLTRISDDNAAKLTASLAKIF
ncbi:MAG: 4-hydroxy-tetrahydrodipicolinate synthase [Christensenellaceae bacterium]|jgi:4-hydroxy-tetrahydrodipicolinate synthase|nr:4-hydroxy-tetrahydrodipicolinate synthase [Christensenellaceae bacterium]